MADTAKRFIGPVQLTTTASGNQYQIPAATTGIIRNIHCQNTTASSVKLYVSMGTTGIDTDASRILAVDVPGNGAYDWSGFIVVDASQYITSKASAATSLTLIVSGVQIT